MKKFCLVFCCIILVGNGAKILGVFDFPGRSHYILSSSLMKALAERGHDVTIVAPFLDEKSPKGGTYRQIQLTGIVDQFGSLMSGFLKKTVDSNPLLMLNYIKVFFDQLDKILAHENTQKLLKANETFDLVIVEQFNNDVMKLFATHFKAPLVVFSSLGANHWVNVLVNNPSPPSYVPDLISGGSSTAKMNFWERLQNAGVQLLNILMMECLNLPRQKEIGRKYFPDENLDDILYNPSIILLNSHPSLNQPVPHVPNMIEIGGFHIRPPKKLPKDLQQYLDTATEGFIYFSMGSNLKSAELPDDVRDAFLKNFRKLKQKVLWKFEEDVLPNQPDNVKIIKWAPQQDILAHPNIKLFITHGGLLSTTETIYHGVPILGIPVFADQYTNSINAVHNGYAVHLPYNDVTEETLGQKLKEILSNPKYMETAKNKSKIFHDRESKPLDTAMFWIEYVIRHKGAPHLMIEGVNLAWYQYLLLDVIAFVVFVSIVILWIVLYILRRLCCHKNKSVKLKQN